MGQNAAYAKSPTCQSTKTFQESLRIFGTQKREEKGVVIHMKEACSKSLDGEEVMGVEDELHLLTAKDPMNKMEKIKETIVADGKRFGEKKKKVEWMQMKLCIEITIGAM
eukprot:833084-Ditylum_brightwellii.AAC.1